MTDLDRVGEIRRRLRAIEADPDDPEVDRALMSARAATTVAIFCLGGGRWSNPYDGYGSPASGEEYRARYPATVAYARHILAETGGHLDDDERALLDRILEGEA